MSGKYDKFIKETRKLYEETGLKSDALALQMHERYPSEINPSAFARHIRRYKWTDIFKPKQNFKVLLLDVETSPIIAGTWSFWSNPMQSMVFKRPMILTWSAKWLLQDEILSDKLTPKEVNDNNDKRIIDSIWKLVNEADVLIAHNGAKFDFKVLNTRFIENKLPKPSSYQFIDTLRHVKRQFRFESNRLDYIARNIFKIDGKMETPKNLWFDAINGKYLRSGGTKEIQTEALSIMEDYNREDVRVLEDVYFLIRPYIQPHPNLALLVDSDKCICPACTSDDFELVGEYLTYVNIFDQFRCKSCQSLFRTRKNTTPETIKNRLLVSTPH